MDNPPRPEEAYDPGYFVTATDASSLKTKNEAYYEAIQRADEDAIYLMSKESNENASMSTSDGSAHSNQVFPATCSRYQNTSSSINSQGSFLSSSRDVSRELDISVGTRNHSVSYYYTAMVSSDPTHNWEKNLSNYRMTTEFNQAHERTGSDICDKSDEGLSNESEQKSMNYSEALEINTTCQTLSDRGLLDGIDHKIQKSTQTFSRYPQNLMLIKWPRYSEENIASNMNIADMSRSDAQSDVSNSILMKMENIRSMDNIVAVPSPSGFNRNIYPTISGDAFVPCFQSKMQAIERNEKKALICSVCKSKINKHRHLNEQNNLYNCCICTYSSSEKTDLLMHSDIHLPKSFCNVCQKEHREGNSHNGNHKCAACIQTFKCKTELNEHILKHINYFKGHCWVCSKNFDDHLKEEKGVEVYVCCICPFKIKEINKFREHTAIHRPKIFCRICKEEYHEGQEVLHNRDFMCVLCQHTFPCQPMLEDHTKENQKYFDLNCIVCNKEIENDHKIQKDKIIFYCCKCFATFNYKYQLLNHLNIHTSLNLFKCYKCGRRFKQKDKVTFHSEYCPAVPYKCKICQARFPRKDFLDLHCSVKHQKV